MSPKKRRFSPLPLVGASIVLMLLPSAASQRARLSMLSILEPFQSLGRRAHGLVRGLKGSSEAEILRKENEFLRDQVVRLTNDLAKERHRREQASNFRQQVRDPAFRLLHADVVLSADGSPWRKSLLLSLGSRDGVEKGMLVVHNNQLVGRVAEAGPFTSRVQLTTDPGFRAGAVAMPRTYAAGVAFDKRQVGLYKGTAGEQGQIEWLMGDAAVEAGAYILTTEDPANGVPAGLILGRVTAVSTGRGLFARVDVEPLVNFRGLEQVMVLGPGGGGGDER